MKTLNYGGVEVTVKSLLELASNLEKEAQIKRRLADRPTLFDDPMPKNLQASYIQQAVDRENEVQAIRSFLARNTEPDTAPIRYIVCMLSEEMGRRLLAHITGVRDTMTIEMWEDGSGTPSNQYEKIVRDAAKVYKVLRPTLSTDSFTSWLVGMNPDLDDQAPAQLLKTKPELVLQAAYAFIA